MKKTLLLFVVLFSTLGAWADFNQTYNNQTPWKKDGFVSPVSARNNSWSVGMSQTPVNVETEGNVTVLFDWDGSSSCGLNILGVDLVDPEAFEVVAFDYKTGKDSWSEAPKYTLNDVKPGNYILRYFVEEDGNHDALNKTGGTVTVTGATYFYGKPLSGFYRIKGQNTEKSYLASTTKNGADLQVVATAEEAGIYYVEDTDNNNDQQNVYLLNYETGKYFYQSNCFTLGDVKEKVRLEIKEVPTSYSVGMQSEYWISIDGTYMFNNNTDGIVHQSGTPNAVAEKHFSFEPVSELPMTIGSTGYATFYSPVAVKVDGITANTVTVNGKYATLNEIEGGVVPANTGVILNGNEGSYNFAITTAQALVDKGDLEGTVAATNVTGEAYVLSAPDGVVGLYKAQLTNGEFKNNAFKAYLPASAVVSNARFLSFDFGGNETAIESVEGENENAKAVVYDLAGRRVQNAQKGIFIVNGKVVIK